MFPTALMYYYSIEQLYVCNVTNGISYYYSEQLKEQLDAAMDEKRKLRLIIHKHEADFLRQHGRSVAMVMVIMWIM